MTVFERGEHPGVVAKVIQEEDFGEGQVQVTLSFREGMVNSDLTVGPDITRCVPLTANLALSCPGVKLHGAGFIVDETQAKRLGLGRVPGLDQHIRYYRNGKDLMANSRDVFVIDLWGLSSADVRSRFPEVYQWVEERVHPERIHNNRSTYRDNWWIFGEPRPELRPALAGLRKFIATVESARRRFFTFLPGNVLPDNTLVAIGLDDSLFLGILSSRIHVVWALAAGGRLGVRNDPRYSKSRCFDPFPFPDVDSVIADRIRALAEELDQHRKRQQSLHPKLQMTKVYKTLNMVRSGEELDGQEKSIHEQGLVTILKTIHDDLDAAVFDAYGWPRDLTDEQILEKLVKLNAERAEEERKGLIRWLRPDFQNPSGQKAATQTEMVGSEESEEDMAAATAAKAWPKKLPEQIAAVRDLLLGQASAWTAKQVAKQFKGTKLKELELVLESLTALGLLVAFQPNGEMQWKPATAAA